MSDAAPPGTRKLAACARLAWRWAWVWGPTFTLLWVHGWWAATLMLASTATLAAVIDHHRYEPLGDTVKRELGL